MLVLQMTSGGAKAVPVAQQACLGSAAFGDQGQKLLGKQLRDSGHSREPVHRTE